MRTIRLYGELGETYGRVHRFKVKSPAEALRALVANFPGFEKDMIESKSKGIGFRVKNGTRHLEDETEVHDPASGEIHITPVVFGAGGGFGKILIGAALIAAAVFVPFLAPVVAQAALGVGLSLVLGGVSQLLSPQPKAQAPPERPENTPSYVFNGPVNTTAQGQAVPIGYGKLIVGGAVLSAGISTEQIKGGFKRVLVEKTTTVVFRYNKITNVEIVISGSVPANFRRRVLTLEQPNLLPPRRTYLYYYPTYEVVNV
jgi:predicted phage tail protein